MRLFKQKESKRLLLLGVRTTNHCRKLVLKDQEETRAELKIHDFLENGKKKSFTFFECVPLQSVTCVKVRYLARWEANITRSAALYHISSSDLTLKSHD